MSLGIPSSLISACYPKSAVRTWINALYPMVEVEAWGIISYASRYSQVLSLGSLSLHFWSLCADLEVRGRSGEDANDSCQGLSTAIEGWDALHKRQVAKMWPPMWYCLVENKNVGTVSLRAFTPTKSGMVARRASYGQGHRVSTLYGTFIWAPSEAYQVVWVNCRGGLPSTNGLRCRNWGVKLRLHTHFGCLRSCTCILHCWYV